MTDTPVTPVPAPVKPELKQITNYVGAAFLGAAGFVVANPALLAALIPPPWGGVVLGALGAGLVAYREKQSVPPPK